jgi:hypothetical protein
LATDGVFDNLYDEGILYYTYKDYFVDIVKLVNQQLTPQQGDRNITKQLEATMKSSNLAKVIAEKAHELAKQQDYVSPFAKGAKEAGKNYPGGKMDGIQSIPKTKLTSFDITVVVALVSTSKFMKPSKSKL